MTALGFDHEFAIGDEPLQRALHHEQRLVTVVFVPGPLPAT